MINKKDRYNYIDIAKGIGIIAVVLGHLNTKGQLNREIIFAFHVPLFFILSGMFSKSEKTFKNYLKDIFFRLYIPYLFFVVIDMFTRIVDCLLVNKPIVMKKQILIIVKNAIGLGRNELLNLALWFLFVLFLIKIIYYMCIKIKYLKYILSICCLVCCMLFYKYLHSFTNDFYFRTLIAFPFFAFGSILGNYIDEIKSLVDKNKILSITIITLVFVFFVFLAHYNGSVDMTFLFGKSILLYFINAILGSFIVIVYSVLLEHLNYSKKILMYFGKNTLIILCFHYVICRRIIPYIFKILNIDRYLYNFGIEIILTIAVLLVMIVAINFSNKYLYKIFGIKNKHTLYTYKD